MSGIFLYLRSSKMINIDQIIAQLKSHPPLVSNQTKPKSNHAGVIALITHEIEPRLLLTQRSENLETHRGQVAFPGGMYEHEDRTLLKTALRETYEEVGIPPSEINVIAKLTPIYSHLGIYVAPYVGLLSPDTPLVKNSAEVAEIFAPPLQFFLNIKECAHHPSPCYHYKQYHIWGLTGSIITELMQIINY